MRLILKSFALEIHMHLIRRKLGARGKISWYNSGSGTFTFKTGIIALFIKHHLTLLSSTQNVYFFMFSAHGKFNFGGKLHNFLGSLLQNSKCWTLSSFERVETNGFFWLFLGRGGSIGWSLWMCSMAKAFRLRWKADTTGTQLFYHRISHG